MKKTEKILGQFGFIVELELDGGMVEFKAFNIEQTDMDGTPISPELYMEGSVRWDGCMNFIHEQGVYGHFCQVSHVVKHCELSRYVYRTAGEMCIEKDPYLSEHFDDIGVLK